MDSQAFGETVDITQLSHLQAWQKSVNRNPTAVALISHHQKPGDFRWIQAHSSRQDVLEWTYTDIDRAARKLATTLNRLTPINRRPIAVLLNNQAEWTLFFWAAAYLHSPLAPINPKNVDRTEEMAHMIDMVKPAVIVAMDTTTAKKLNQSTEGVSVKIILNGIHDKWCNMDNMMTSDSTPPDTPTYADPAETAVILFTSGTTSLPKPCGISSAQTAHAATVYVDTRSLKSTHRYISHLPNFHSYGIGWKLAFYLLGGTVILPAESFEAYSSLLCIEKYGATHVGLVPTTAQTIATHPAFSTTNISTLVSVDISGAGIVPSVLEECQANFGVPAGTSYGMTESPSTLIFDPREGTASRDGNVLAGRPTKGAKVRICEPGTHTPVPRGVAGELHSGGVQVITSYMNGVSSDAFYTDADGQWIITGDQAIMEIDGNIRISGRYKDIIIRGGENISPASIEACLTRASGIYSAQVVGIPDDTAGEIPIAVVQTVDDAQVQSEELKKMATSCLGPAFAPKMVLDLRRDLNLEAFPTTANGKIRKVELVKHVLEYLRTLQSNRTIATSTIEILLHIWQDISGANSLTGATTLQSFADSLMMMQLSSKVKRSFNKDITVEDFKDCTTIQDQAELIDLRSYITFEANLQERSGAPRLQDIPHLHDNMTAFTALKSEVTSVLAKHYLTWNDVEDVAPLPDWDAVFAHKSRSQSWNLRWSYHCKVSSQDLHDAVREMLRYHPVLRSVVVPSKDDSPLLVSLRANDAWYDTALTVGHEVDTEEELKDLLLDDPILDSAVAGGPMFRAHIASIRSNHTSGMVVVASHAVCDMSMTKLWLDDLTAVLTRSRLAPHVSFFKYANAFNAHREGTDATTAVRYWANKLAGLGSIAESGLWPPQRAPEYFKGNDVGWQRWDGRAARSIERNVALSDKRIGQNGIRRIITIDTIARLKAEYDVPVFMLVKAAIALLNISRTKTDEAVFGTLNAARTWPFKVDYNSDELEGCSGNPLDISGCTTEYVLDRVKVNLQSTVVDFMQFVTKDEDMNSAYVKAPIYRIIDTLRDQLSRTDERTWLQRERDADAVLASIRRQSFNWLPTAPAAQDNDDGLRMIQMLTRMDNGLTITGFLADDKRSVVIGLTWDAEHMSLSDAELALDDLLGLISSLSDTNTWKQTVADIL